MTSAVVNCREILIFRSLCRLSTYTQEINEGPQIINVDCVKNNATTDTSLKTKNSEICAHTAHFSTCSTVFSLNVSFHLFVDTNRKNV